MVKRYDFGPVQPEHHERDGGDWAHYSDYAALEAAYQAKTELCKASDVVIAKLEAECARLTSEVRTLREEMNRSQHEA